MGAISARVQLLCLWGGPAAMLLTILGFMLLAGLVPPPSPSDGPEEIRDFYLDNADRVKAGLVLTILAGALTGPFVGVISAQMKRVEGEFSPLAYTQLGMGMLGVLLFVIPAMLLQAAVFRAERDPELMLLLSDFAWLQLVGVISFGVVQNLAIAGCVLIDREERVFPRWLAYVNIWVALLFLPAALIYFFKSGPFAWNGIFTFWIPLSSFFAWFILMFVVLRASVRRQATGVPA